ncbi:hypothetical protein Tsubulata_044527 [Turnera subulata]|uniref:Fe2OG dioxygenase domain-containing protein n=1 Tax=Turnera subulata TaxID=218843 RepID=A0A9Q0FK24_9ROSI|nr:hypothetical protein Tsubulata_044527 [Turnera subulata]
MPPLPAKSVPEMSVDGDEPPPQYIVKECNFAPLDLSTASGPFPIPIIDISLFSESASANSSKKEAADEALEQLRSALISAGCFQAVGHGMSSSFLDKVREVARQFFALPLEEKQKYARAENESEGFGSDTVVSDKQVLDWSNRLTLQVFPEERRRLNLWPKTPNEFGETLHEYGLKVRSAMALMYKAMARSLNLEENSFLGQMGDNSLNEVRMNFYPPCSRPDLVLGLKPHTDRSAMTVLLQDSEVESLQMLIDDKWVKVPIVKDALVVNLGDQMEIMSNGVFKSPLHRVVSNSGKLRVSLAFLSEPEPEKEIGPVDALVDEHRPRGYKNVKSYGSLNYTCYQKGMVAIDMVKM